MGLARIGYQELTCVYSLSEVTARLEYWQRILNLTEWTLSVEIVRRDKFDGLLLGDVEILPLKQIAVIRLLDPIDFVADYGFISKHDMELTLVHELLHVRLHGMQDDALAVRKFIEERAVHALSMTLTNFHRNGALL